MYIYICTANARTATRAIMTTVAPRANPPLVRLRRARVRVGRCGSSANVVRRVCVCCIAFVAESDLVEEPLYLGRVLGSVAVNEDARVRGGEEGEEDEEEGGGAGQHQGASAGSIR